MRNPLTIEAGSLRIPIAIQQQSSTQDSFGQELTQWIAVLSTRAAIRTLTLTEKSNAAGFQSQATHRVTMRYQPNVALTAGMRILAGTHTYILQAVENVEERNRVITCLALEQVPTQ